jgi:O-antigen/teichoic acid export membrane protein
MNATETVSMVPTSEESPRSSRQDRETVVRKVVRGSVALGMRQVFVHGANILGAVLLARILSPLDFGVYAIVTFLVSFLGTFGGTGLAANLIRMHPAPTDHDYHSVFTFQQLAVGALATVFWLCAPLGAAFYHLSPGASWVFRLAAASLVATSWMVPAQVQMERDLNFRKLALIETTQAVLFNVVAVSMAWLGYGAISFGVALCVRALTGALMANWTEPCCYGWVWDWSTVKRHLRFGVLFQGAQILCLLKDSITPILVGFLVGTAGVGYISWALMLSSYPVMTLMVLKRIYLPTFAHFQNDRGELATCFERVIWLTTSVTAPLAVALLLFVYPITDLVFGAKWESAIPLFYWFWAANAFVPTANPAVSLLNSLGHVRVPTMFALLWMAGTWMIGWPMTVSMGILGIAIANCVVQFTNLFLFRIARKHVPFRIANAALVPWLLAAGAGLPLLLCMRVAPIHTLFSLAVCISAHLSLYLLLMFLVYRKRILRLVQVGLGGATFAFRPW